MIGTQLGKWKTGRMLGQGGCATVYEVQGSNPALVIKCAEMVSGKTKIAQEKMRLADTLYYEYVLYNGVLNEFKYKVFIPPGSFGEANGYRYLVMEKLDFDLDHLARCGDIPSHQTIHIIGSHILDGLQYIHSHGYVYVDLKPGNFMVKKNSNSSQAELTATDSFYFIDFGLMEKFTNYVAGGIRANIQSKFAGTPTYASLAALEGSPVSRKDDIEALVSIFSLYVNSNINAILQTIFVIIIIDFITSFYCYLLTYLLYYIYSTCMCVGLCIVEPTMQT